MVFDEAALVVQDNGDDSLRGSHLAEIGLVQSLLEFHPEECAVQPRFFGGESTDGEGSSTGGLNTAS
ncbi:hypothetical protein AXK58_00615 [Tsukamurella tyrosinosolvens]|nr:hypothetical protein AXK58_00615 [Tsukamurella tyrosinosolvens]